MAPFHPAPQAPPGGDDDPTKSYRSKEPVRVIGELWVWQGHDPAVLQAMKDNLARLALEGVEADD